MPMMLEAALRAAALIGVVLALLRLGVGVRTAVWRATLSAALLIPLLMPLFVVKVGDRALEQVVVTADRSIRGLLPKAVFVHHGPGFSIAFYIFAAVLLVFVIRLIAGVLLTWQIARHAPPITAKWADGAVVRKCRRISVPVTFGHIILLPADVAEWPASKRIAVMAHERAHVENHDFYWQILAHLHRAIFWFNPLAWWLLAEMSRLDELVSDDAAIGVLGDRPHYAEVLLTMSNTQDYLPSGIAMARTAGIKQRIEYVLAAVTPSARLSKRARVAISALAVPLAIAYAIGVTPARAHTTAQPVAIGAPHRCIQYYPKEAVQTHAEGRNSVLFDVTETGTVANIQIEQSSGSPLLDAAAIVCVQSWQYQPVVQDGHPVSIPWRASIVWSLHGKPNND